MNTLALFPGRRGSQAPGQRPQLLLNSPQTVVSSTNIRNSIHGGMGELSKPALFHPLTLQSMVILPPPANPTIPQPF